MLADHEHQQAMNIDKKALVKIGLRLVTRLFSQEIECRNCGARWRLQKTAEEQRWLCPNGCNSRLLASGKNNVG